MKKLFIFIIFFGIFSSCEDVIEVELNEAPPRLVIEANCNKNIDEEQVQATVRLTTTKPFFGNENTEIADAEVKIITEEGFIINLEYFNNGRYSATFPIEAEKEYTLEIVHQGETYSATEVLYNVSPLEFVEQRNDGGFTGEDIELKVFFTDPADQRNFYFFEGLSEKGDVLDVYNDEFFDGNTIFGYFLVDDLAPEDQVQFNIYGVSQAYYNFMFILLQQTSDQGGGPFETQPATVRGNIVNETNPDNYPLGYFRISEVSTLNYTVQ
ncbi:DUF4249 domain-containing protein [Aequorivita marisscotiae]|uniref:DUF4249 domain-containing protein n=1 Tax=Aequorivita marisscotiae TaxID=3040348 RepID=A0ABY8KU84_9FLAO|nr:DUF4249 domain-containing protein [Aequorivita sp. Ant34-E75]WGF92623.1 DUF4249 domain-containing protein [Aequorivita sp. Ant34-E75]